MEELISKKDLLIKENISYGQLYRWKRKNIIPEEWFIKKSTFTGQETFFPKKKILERIELILSMKDDVSLDEIANMFNGNEENRKFNVDNILDKGIITEDSRNIFYSLCGEKGLIEKRELCILIIIDKFLLKSIITMEEIKSIINIVNRDFEGLFNEDGRIIVFRKLGISFVVGCKNYKDSLFEERLIKVLELDLIKEISNVNRKLL